MKLVSLLVCFSLIGVVSADLLSRSLTWDLQVDDAAYAIYWDTAEPASMSVLETVAFTLRLEGPDIISFELVFRVSSLPAGASYSDVVLTVVGDGAHTPDVNGEVITALGMTGGVKTISFELAVDYTGAWQFIFVMQTP